VGAFLQKTSVVRGYLEGLVSARAHWPRALWEVRGGASELATAGLTHTHAAQLYSPAATGGLAGLRTVVAGGEGEEEADSRALACLNHVAADALTALPSCLRYLAAVQHSPDVFRFAAVPMVRR